MSEPWRVASLNVLRLSSREKQRAARIGAFLGELGTDVVALQEVEGEPAADVARRAGFDHCTFVGHALSRRRGVALLHRSPALVSGGARFPARLGDDKGYTRAVVLACGREIEILGVHLDWLSRRARAGQIEALARAVGPACMPRVVLGDLNAMTLGTWARGDAVDDTVSALALALGLRPSSSISRTFPGRAPRWALDWILASPELDVSALEVVPTALSDHAAIVAEITLAGAA
jgi:endonuclease/exonuclease/phosphatase family metal-dependent hydrolase